MDSTTLTIQQMKMFDYIYENNYKNQIKYDYSPITNKINSIDILKRTLMNKLTFNKLDVVEVRKSTVHGNGVFAKQNIKKNDILTFYPVDILKFRVEENLYIPSFSKRYLNKYGPEYEKKFEHYQYCTPDNNIIVGCPDFIDNNNYIGHIINDISKHNKTKKSIEEYEKISENCNATLYNCSKYNLYVPVIANRDITKDEEIFVHYGVQYWNTYK